MSRETRAAGFPTADLDTGYFDDLKLRALRRALPDVAAMNHAIVLHLAVVLESWAAGDRISYVVAAPLWLDPDPGAVTALQTVGLLDAEGCIPESAWNGWYTLAFERREKSRDRWKKANDRRPRRPSSSGSTAPTEPSVPLLPSVSDETSPRGNGDVTARTPEPVPFPKRAAR